MHFRTPVCQMVRVIVLLTLLAGCTGVSSAPEREPLRVLFVGNSYTASNDLSGMFTELARSGGHEVSAEAVQEGGWTLSAHASSRRTLEKIERQKRDVIVLQEQSVVPSVEPYRSEEMYPAVRRLDGKIRKSGGRTVLFMTWGRREGLASAGHKNFGEMQARLDAGYRGIARELHVMVAPVGIAWQSALSRDPRLELWQSDGSHPAVQGSYLAACVFYAVIFRQSPEGLSYTAGLSRTTAHLLQSVAAKTVLDHPEQWHLRAGPADRKGRR